MNNTTLFLSVAIAGFFFIYGIQCLKSSFMAREFQRYGMSDNMRKLTGITQLLGASGLLAGLYLHIIGLLAATGLSLMMLVAFGTRLKVQDPLNQTLPSLFFMVLNGYLAFEYLTLFLTDL